MTVFGRSARWCLALFALGGCASSETGGAETDGAFDPTIATSTGSTGGLGPVLAFEGSVPLLPGLDLDTGWQPSEGPAGVRLTVAAFGSADSSGRGHAVDGTLHGIAESGELAVSGGFTFDLTARVNTLGFDEEVELESFEFVLPTVAETFEPFVVGDTQSASTPLPPTELGTVPIPSIPGASVSVEVTGGTLDTTYQTSCAASDATHGQAAGVFTSGGSIDLAATIEIEVPLAPPQSFGPFAITVPIAALAVDVDLGTRALADGSSAADAGLCRASATTTDGSAGSDTDDTDDTDESSTGEAPPDTDTDSDDSGPASTSDPVDPCADVSCGADELCEAGVCVPTDDTSSPPQCEPGTCDVCEGYEVCVDCAESPGGECTAARDACQANPACVAIEQCIEACSDPTCPQQCQTSNPSGAADYDAIRSCRVETCQS